MYEVQPPRTAMMNIRRLLASVLSLTMVAMTAAPSEAAGSKKQDKIKAAQAGKAKAAARKQVTGRDHQGNLCGAFSDRSRGVSALRRWQYGRYQTSFARSGANHSGKAIVERRTQGLLAGSSRWHDGDRGAILIVSRLRRSVVILKISARFGKTGAGRTS